jgi:hypothetical protein
MRPKPIQLLAKSAVIFWCHKLLSALLAMGKETVSLDIARKGEDYGLENHQAAADGHFPNKISSFSIWPKGITKVKRFISATPNARNRIPKIV